MTRLVERVAVAMAIVGAVAACDPLGTNKLPSVASISDLALPSPSVVVGEIMRDSLGVEAPLRLNAYDSDGRLLPDQAVFTVVDTSVQIDQSGLVHGKQLDSVGARVFAGVGTLQTPQIRIPVTVHPTAATTAVTAPAINFPVPVVDSANNANWSPNLDVTITGLAQGKGQLGAQGFIVTYSITRSPAGAFGSTTTYLIDADATRKTSRDTTNSSGKASRRVVLRSALLADNTKTDTIVVRATASYGGSVISGFPIDFTIQIKKTP